MNSEGYDKLIQILLDKILEMEYRGLRPICPECNNRFPIPDRCPNCNSEIQKI